MMWNREYEAMPRDQLEALQLERLQAKVQYVYEKVPFYRQAMKRRGVAPADIRSLDDLDKLPFTAKADFRDNYPFGLLAVPMEEVVRVHASSGTTGKPTVVAYTRNDINVWAVRSRLGLWPPATSRKRTWCRTPMATGCSRGGWECITAGSSSGRP